MKKITRTSEEYRKAMEKDLEERKCPECEKEGELTAYGFFERFYSCECGCSWHVVDEHKKEKYAADVELIKKEPSIFAKIVGKFGR